MHDKLGKLLACPICSASLLFEGTIHESRYINGYFKCPLRHMFQVKDANEKKYLEVRQQYDYFLRDDQKATTQKISEKLADYVSRSALQSDNTVLDVASGMGTFLIPLLNKISADSKVVGTDIDERPLRGLMNRSLKAGTYNKLSLVVTDAKHLCFKNAVFSTVSSFFGFDNVPETMRALKECARVLHPNGRTHFVSLWYREGSESMKLAEKHNVGQIASEGRLKDALAKSGLILDQVEEMYSGLWPYNPMDLLPVEGDEYAHVIVSARKARR
jgi:ubiquinone/menaquinone biosynthesis C-methylase UbiE